MAQGIARTPPFRISAAGRAAALATTLMLGACAGSSDPLSGGLLLAENEPAADAASGDPQAELKRATEYWGKEYASKPNDRTAALSYAKNLKAMGDKRLALNVLRSAHAMHAKDPEIAGEYGRLALEADQVGSAAAALQIADVPEKPDWRVISARGTVLAKQGQHKAAIPYFERALALAPNQPSVMNNLAMATAMSGNAQKAEEILRTASQQDGAPGKVNQNLALVLGLQGKYDESKVAGSMTAPTDVADANTEYLRRMVRLEPKKSAPQPAPAFATSVASAAAPAASSFKPAAVENTSAGGNWQTAVTANAAPALRSTR